MKAEHSVVECSPIIHVTFFDIADRYAVVYGSTLTRTIAWTASVGAGAVWLLLTGGLWRRVRWAGLVLTPLWASLAAAAAIGAPVAAVWTLRAARKELNPWYAAPHWLFGLLLAAACVAVWWVGRLAALVPEQVRPSREPAAIWWVTLPVWTVLAILLQRTAPAASFLVTLPLAAAAVSVSKRSTA